MNVVWVVRVLIVVLGLNVSCVGVEATLTVYLRPLREVVHSSECPLSEVPLYKCAVWLEQDCPFTIKLSVQVLLFHSHCHLGPNKNWDLLSKNTSKNCSHFNQQQTLLNFFSTLDILRQCHPLTCSTCFSTHTRMHAHTHTHKHVGRRRQISHSSESKTSIVKQCCCVMKSTL